MAFSIKRSLSIARKEYFHILRDKYTLGIALFVPLFIVIVFGIIIDFDVKNISLGYSDKDRTQTSREVLTKLESSNYFILNKPLYNQAHEFKALETGTIKASIEIPKKFESKILGRQGSDINILIDGADNSTAGVIATYFSKIAKDLNLNYFNFSPPYELRTQFYFNGELLSSWFIVPGLTAIILALISILLTALTISKEWENGSMELLLTTPVTRLEIIVGKLIPYLIISLIALGMVLVISFLYFELPFKGSIFSFIFLSFTFLLACLAQGLLISILFKTQQVAMQISIITGLLPSLLLSGFIFPIENMPKVFQILTSILPARWYMEISRGIFLKGASFYDLALPGVVLIFLTLLLIVLAYLKFKPNLES